jgi:hypothetical protein
VKKQFIALSLLLLTLCCTAALRAQSPAPTAKWEPVQWSFPKAGMTPLEVDGQKVYQLSTNIFGVKEEFRGRELMRIHFAQEIVSAAQLVHVEDPKGMPDVAQFMAALAVKMAVDTPEDYTNQFLGSGKVEGVLMYFYKTKSGANVAAMVAADGRKVLLLPAPSEK